MNIIFNIYMYLPENILSYILLFITPNISFRSICADNLIRQKNKFKHIILTSKLLKININMEIYNNIKVILYLIEKYNLYQRSYEYFYKPPILYDILLKDYNIQMKPNRYLNYNEILLEEIKQIISIIPLSLEADYGCFIEGRNKITPLYIACVNQNIKVETIEFLIKNGANINSKIEINQDEISILDDLNNLVEMSDIISKDRFDTVKKIFERSK